MSIKRLPIKICSIISRVMIDGKLAKEVADFDRKKFWEFDDLKQARAYIAPFIQGLRETEIEKQTQLCIDAAPRNSREDHEGAKNDIEHYIKGFSTDKTSHAILRGCAHLLEKLKDGPTEDEQEKQSKFINSCENCINKVVEGVAEQHKFMQRLAKATRTRVYRISMLNLSSLKSELDALKAKNDLLSGDDDTAGAACNDEDQKTLNGLKARCQATFAILKNAQVDLTAFTHIIKEMTALRNHHIGCKKAIVKYTKLLEALRDATPKPQDNGGRGIVIVVLLVLGTGGVVFVAHKLISKKERQSVNDEGNDDTTTTAVAAPTEGSEDEGGLIEGQEQRPRQSAI